MSPPSAGHHHGHRKRSLTGSFGALEIVSHRRGPMPDAYPQPEFIIVDGASGLEKALVGLWPNAPVQRCTVHKNRNLLAHAPKETARGNLGGLF